MTHQTIVFLVVTALHVWANYSMISRGYSPVHWKHQILRTALWAVAAVWLQSDIKDIVMYFLAYHFAFWFTFDTSLNLLRGKAWFYMGDPLDPEEDSWVDNMSLKWPAAALGFKVILFLIGMGTLIFGTYW
jgi:hypothetical protein